ncbi:class I tRNA ligase family protein [Candidatus Gracilibacteria bacterium]|nr:class I tRNA ligase family protein [Candidatus Gracilibacteria bacterium]
MTYAVLAPDHPKVSDFITNEHKKVCEEYITHSAAKSDQDRTQADKEKTGVFTGSYVINPFNNQAVPLWIGDYVLGNYGTGAVMAVPAHDERDFEFAKKYDLKITESVRSFYYGSCSKEWKNSNISKFPELGNMTEEQIVSFISEQVQSRNTAYTGAGKLVDSGDFSNLESPEARQKLTQYAKEKGFGEKKVNYKLRDWLFSRQRYWGEPIPLIHLDNDDFNTLSSTPSNQAWIKDGNILMIGEKEFSKIYDGLYGKIVCDYKLPLELPEVEDFEPSGDGNSPLAKVDSFIHVALAENLNGKRETNTMPQWGGSCWYYLRYMDPKNTDKIVDPEVERYWGQVDSYVGGAEHAVLHLLYARFWHKFLFDIGVVSSNEPFYRLRNQGLILAHAFQRKNGGLLANDLVEEKDGKYFEIATGEEVDRIVSKMSKSLKNVVNPDEIVDEYGADSLRLYEMYMADFKDAAPWDTKGIIGVRRFLEKSERLFTQEAKLSSESDEFTMKLVHKTIKKIEEDIENYKFNTAIAQLMILVNNGLPKDTELQREWRSMFVRILNPFAPHLAEELWERMTPPQSPSAEGEANPSEQGEHSSVFHAPWPEYDEAMTIDNTITIGVQVLGKLRGEIEIGKDEDKDSVLEKAKNNENVARFLEGKNLVKEIYVPGKIVNLVVK